MDGQRVEGWAKALTAAASRRAVVKALVGAAVVGRFDAARSAEAKAKAETLVVPFALGTAGVATARDYAGWVTITVSGFGQAAGSQHSDAFYVFTDEAGNPVEPWHPTEYYNWSLWINGGPADAWVQPIPAYRGDHVYTFQIHAKGGKLTFAFGVGDIFTEDNTGAYTVTIRKGRRPAGDGDD